MHFHWSYTVIFLFEELKSTPNNKNLFFFCIFLSFILGLISQYTKYLKKRLLKKQASKFTIIVIETFRYFLDALVMLLLMTFNWTVVLAVIIGQSLGFLAGINDKQNTRAHHDESWVGEQNETQQERDSF
jgi:uncharacterized membrane protein